MMALRIISFGRWSKMCWGHFQQKPKAKSSVRFSTRACTRGHTSLWAGFQQGAVASRPGPRRGNWVSDRLIGLDPDKLTRRAPPVWGPELTPWSCFNSPWLRAERLKKQQIWSLKASASTTAVNYLTIAAQLHVTIARTFKCAHPGGEGNKDKPIWFLRELNDSVTQLVQHFSLIGDT